jgi:hypothetical protein
MRLDGMAALERRQDPSREFVPDGQQSVSCREATHFVLLLALRRFDWRLGDPA